MGLFETIKDIFAKPAPSAEPKAEEPVTAEPEEPEVAAPGVHWTGDMILRAAGRGEPIERSGGGGYMRCGSARLEWVSRETDGEGKPLRTRTPESQVMTMPYGDFTAAGKHYSALRQLVSKWEAHSSWARDIYGRSVLAVAERFPCFDSSDFLYEDRYFRWFLLCEDGKLTCVYHTDNTDTVTVTEDVLDLEERCWKQMQSEKCFEEDGI